MTIDQLKVAATAAYEAHMASGIIVDIHKDMLAESEAQQAETRRLWLYWSNKLHEAEIEVAP